MISNIHLRKDEFPETFELLEKVAATRKKSTGVEPSRRKLAAESLNKGCRFFLNLLGDNDPSLK